MQVGWFSRTPWIMVSLDVTTKKEKPQGRKVKERGIHGNDTQSLILNGSEGIFWFADLTSRVDCYASDLGRWSVFHKTLESNACCRVIKTPRLCFKILPHLTCVSKHISGPYQKLLNLGQ